MPTISRRRMLQGVVAGTVAGTAGCLGENSGSTESMTVAYVPIYPNMQHYVMEEEGFYEEIPTDVSVERFGSGPDIVTAFASGEVDVALFGITPAMVLVDRGVDASVLAANSRNGFKVVATSEVADRFERAGATAFENFEAENGRPIRFGVPPDGSVPDVVLRFWIEETLGIGAMEETISKSTVSPPRAAQTIQSGDIDATMIQEPFATIIGQDDGFRELVWSGNILENHPVTVLFANQDVVEESAVAESLVEKHSRATAFIQDSPDVAAADAAAVIGDAVDETRARAALDSRASDFLSDPHTIAPQTAPMAEFVADVGNTDQIVATEQLFEFGVYDAVQQ
ncbi:ABC transporter substrate-binding protein [Halovenus amylolytica]|uniref:ABC transporter substrate-binding protein n=1 Tax=Halovenus amylolytica TaxID=2500550 RepID=UPI003622E8E3